MRVLEASNWIEALDLQGVQAPDLFTSEHQINSEAPLQQAQVLRQAMERLGLDGILCVASKPAAYIKVLPEEDDAALRNLHKLAWSQGVAPLLIVFTGTTVRVLSCLTLPSRPDHDLSGDGRLVEILDLVRQAAELKQIASSLRMGTYFDASERSYDHKKSFNPRLRVDRYLLDNLNAARKALEEVSFRFSRSDVHRLLGRVIFACYLVDRKIFVGADFDEIGALKCRTIQDILEEEDRNDLLFALFSKLQRDFNGDMFAGDLNREKQAFTDGHADILKRFLNGENVAVGQLSLGFWAYDFSIIPIETISAIYESFLEADDPGAKKKIGAYYTPRFLCEVVLDQALAGEQRLQGRRYLDPSCGSGIFLVGLFNRMAEEWRRENPDHNNEQRFQALVSIVQQSIFGVDVSETACRIAALSLYLAILDQLVPREIRGLPERALPKLVCLRDGSPDGSGLNLIQGNFFGALPDHVRGFDVIVGNPPWVRKESEAMEEWRSSANRFIAQKQAAHGFIWKSGEHLAEGGVVCFLLPAGVFFNHKKSSLKFQREWLTAARIHSVLNLADLCFYLFENAIRPAVAVRFSFELPEDKHRFEYLVPKTDPETLRAELLSLHAADSSKLSQKTLIRALSRNLLPPDWKRRMWGTARDREFLERLDEYPRLALHIKRSGWTAGSGMQPMGENDTKGKEATFDPEALFLGGSREAKVVLVPSDCQKLGDRAYGEKRRSAERKREIFEAPHVLVGMKLQTVFADFDTYFQDAVRGIHGPEEDREELMFLAAVLGSDLAQYYFFHSSSNWGVERDKVQLDELGQLPFFIADDKQPKLKEVRVEVVRLMEDLLTSLEADVLGQADSRETVHRQIQPLINRYFEVDPREEFLIRDALSLWIPSSTPGRNSPVKTITVAPKEERIRYAAILDETLNGWATNSKQCIQIENIVSKRLGIGVVSISITSSKKRTKPKERDSWEELESVLEQAANVIGTRSEVIQRVRDLRIFIGDRLYLFKPLQRRFWSPSIALNDADEIAGEIMFGGPHRD